MQNSLRVFFKKECGQHHVFRVYFTQFLGRFLLYFTPSQVYSSISMFNIRFLCYRMPCLVCNIVGSLKIPDKRVNQNICATVSNSKQLSWNDRNVSNCNEMAGNVRNVTVSNCKQLLWKYKRCNEMTGSNMNHQKMTGNARRCHEFVTKMKPEGHFMINKVIFETKVPCH